MNAIGPVPRRHDAGPVHRTVGRPAPAGGFPARSLLPPAGVVLALIGIWSVLSVAGLFPPSVVPSPLTVARGLGREIWSGRLADDVVASLFRVAVGFSLAVGLGLPLGMWLGRCALARAALLPVVNFFRSLSPLAWIPFAILWFGLGDAPVVFLIFMATFFPMVLAVAGAVATIPAVYFRVAADCGIRGRDLLLEVMLPAILPQAVTAVRVTAGLAWLVMVAAEMVAGRDGLGFAIWDARNGMRMDLLVAEMTVIGLIGVVLDGVLVRLAWLPGVRWGYER